MLVHTDNLTKRYGSFTALDGCSLSVAEGHIFGLLGPNGAGKTTLLRLLLGYIRPTSGAATVAGFDCVSQSLEVRARTAYLPGEARLFRRMDGHRVLDFFASLRPGSRRDVAAAVARRLDLDCSRQVARMSTGMRQKLALAVVLAMETPLVILDEPTANLDPTARAEVLDLVLEARAADYVMIDPTWVGGISATRRIAELAQLYNVPALMHDCTGPFTLLAGINVAAANTGVAYQETVRAHIATIYPDLIDENLSVVDGRIAISQRPGLGARWLPELFEGGQPGYRRSSL
ncbi:MAG: ATP-binding cassette domain-containing protein [Hyphomicrobiales bacterium]